VATGREVGQEAFDLGAAQGVGVSPAVRAFVEAQVLFDPGEVALLGAVSVVFEAEHLPHLVQEFHGASSVGIGRARFVLQIQRGLASYVYICSNRNVK